LRQQNGHREADVTGSGDGNFHFTLAVVLLFCETLDRDVFARSKKHVDARALFPRETTPRKRSFSYVLNRQKRFNPT
jgi:hypothetical protein